jgi:hypothetical protein
MDYIDYDKPITDKDGNPLKILEVGQHFCIRIQKRARALRKLGYTVYGMGHKIAYGSNEYETYTVWQNEKQLKNAVKMFIDQGVKILVWSNEPDVPAVWIKEVIKDMGVEDSVKLICDLHDIDSVRQKAGIIPIPERRMINASDGLIYVSLPTQAITNELHTITKPNICLYSYCNEDLVDYNIEDMKERKALIYEGGANVPDDKVMNKAYPYRNLFPIMKQLVAQGNEVHAYLGNSDAYLKGQGMGVVLHPPTDYDEMMKALTKFKWGLLIFNNKDNTEPQVRYTLTNKAQEYLQAGVPSLACWCEETEKWVRKHNIGLTFNDISEIGNCSEFEDRYEELFFNIAKKRKDLVMENFIYKVENLYSELLGLNKKGVPDKIKELNELEYN